MRVSKCPKAGRTRGPQQRLEKGTEGQESLFSLVLFLLPGRGTALVWTQNHGRTQNHRITFRCEGTGVLEGWEEE